MAHGVHRQTDAVIAKPNRRIAIILSIIILISILLKTILFYCLYHGDPSRIMLDDSISYLIPAHSFLTSGQFLEAPHAYMIFRTPGYPVFLAAIFYLFGQHLTAIIYTQVLLSIIPIVCAYLIGKKLFSENAGLCAAFLVAFDYLFWGHGYFILSDTLFAVMLSLVYLMGVYLFFSFQKKHFFYLGLFLALATLIRPASYLLIFPLAVALLGCLIANKFSWKKSLVMLLIFLMPTIVLIGGWQVRNHIVVGTYQFSKITGTLGMQVFFPENYRLYIQEQTEKNKNYQPNKIGIKEDMQMLLQYPLSTSKQVMFGMAKTLIMPDRAWMQLVGNDQDIAQLDNVKQMFYQFHAARAWQEFKNIPLHSFTLVYVSGAIGISIFLYLFMLIGVFRKKPVENSLMAHLFLLGCALYFLLISSNAESSVRYRLPFEIIIDVYAAAGLMWFYARFREKFNLAK